LADVIGGGSAPTAGSDITATNQCCVDYTLRFFRDRPARHAALDPLPYVSLIRSQPTQDRCGEDLFLGQTEVGQRVDILPTAKEQQEPCAAFADVQLGCVPGAVEGPRLVTDAWYGGQRLAGFGGLRLDGGPVSDVKLDAGGEVAGGPLAVVERPDLITMPERLAGRAVNFRLGQQGAGIVGTACRRVRWT
jgi:hypothetical protein